MYHLCSKETRQKRTMVEFITMINGILVALKVTRFEITFASRIIHLRMYITEFNPISCAHAARAIRVDHKENHVSGILRRVCARMSHTDMRHEYRTHFALWWRMSGTRRVEWILSQYTAGGPWGFPPCRGLFPTRPPRIVFAKSSNEMVDALVREGGGRQDKRREG